MSFSMLAMRPKHFAVIASFFFISLFLSTLSRSSDPYNAFSKYTRGAQQAIVEQEQAFNITADFKNETVVEEHDVMENLVDIYNETLGFQEIIVISLPERSDKRDAWAVQGNLFNLQFSFSDGADSSKIPEKALPHTMDRTGSTLACWRAHMNVLQDVVKRGVKSVLIFEDDADWDISLRSQLTQFAQGARYILSDSPEVTPSSPYGDNWDMFWLGHCGAWPGPEDVRRWVIPEDRTVAPSEGLFPMVGSPPHTGPDNNPHTRVVHKAQTGVCLAGYALTLEAAKKALYHMSLMPYNNAVDWGYGGLCESKNIDFDCVAPFPPYFGAHRPAGNSSKWSDIGYGPESNHGIESTAHTERVVFSTRMNIGRLLDGEVEFESQYPSFTETNLTVEQIATATGYGYVMDTPDLFDTDHNAITLEQKIAMEAAKVAAEAARIQEQDDARRKYEEEEARRKQEEEEARRKQEEEDYRKKEEEENARRKQQKEAARVKQEKIAAKAKQAEDEARRKQKQEAEPDIQKTEQDRNNEAARKEAKPEDDMAINETNSRIIIDPAQLETESSN